MQISLKQIQYLFLFAYLFFLSFFNFTPFYLVSAILLAATTLLAIIERRKFIMTKYFYFECVFILYNTFYLISKLTINALDTSEALKTLLLNFIINMSIINTIENEKELLFVLKAFIPIAVFSNLFALIYSHGGGADGRLMHGLTRPFSSTNYTSMEFASWAIYAGTICIFLAVYWSKNKYLLFLPLYWIIIIWSGSRKWLVFGAFLQFSVYLFCTYQQSLKKYYKKIIIITLLISIAICFLLFNETLYNLIGYRIVGFFNGTESSASTRNYLQETAIKFIKERPYFGYGLNTFQNVNIYNNWTEINYLELAFGGGIVLVVIYYGFIIYLILELLRQRKRDKLSLLLSLILIMILLSDSMSMSYLQRLEQFFIALSALDVWFHKRGKCIYVE